MSLSNVPIPSLGPNGYVTPSESAILAGVQADQQAAFNASGLKLNPALNTPQGQLATSQSAIIAACFDQFAYIVNQIDPQYASGRMQDAIANIYFLSRNPPTSTVVNVTVGGLPGTVVPVGAQAIDLSGNIYNCTEAVTIPAGGSIGTTFAAAIAGPIACPTGALNAIYIAIPGWDTITNANPGAVGSNVESTSAFALRIGQSVAGNSINTLAAILAAVIEVPNVISTYVTENYTNSPVTVGGVTIAANSLYVCVAGGLAQSVANALFSKKPPGCAYTGNTTLTTYDTSAIYPPPGIAYQTTFQVAADVTLFFNIVMKNSAAIPANALSLVQGAINNAMSGLDGLPKPQIGNLILANRFVPGIIALGTWAALGLISLTIGTSVESSAAVVTGSITGTQMTVTAVTSGTLAAQQIISGTGITAGTTIISQVSGTAGGIGVYNISNNTPVSSETITAYNVTSQSAQMLISQMPVTSNNYISLTLQ